MSCDYRPVYLPPPPSRPIGRDAVKFIGLFTVSLMFVEGCFVLAWFLDAVLRP